MKAKNMIVVEIVRFQQPPVFTKISEWMFNSRKFETGPILMKDFKFTCPKVDVPNYFPEERVSVRQLDIIERGPWRDPIN